MRDFKNSIKRSGLSFRVIFRFVSCMRHEACAVQIKSVSALPFLYVQSASVS